MFSHYCYFVMSMFISRYSMEHFINILFRQDWIRIGWSLVDYWFLSENMKNISVHIFIVMESLLYPLKYYICHIEVRKLFNPYQKSISLRQKDICSEISYKFLTRLKNISRVLIYIFVEWDLRETNDINIYVSNIYYIVFSMFKI